MITRAGDTYSMCALRPYDSVAYFVTSLFDVCSDALCDLPPCRSGNPNNVEDSHVCRCSQDKRCITMSLLRARDMHSYIV